MTPQRDIEAYKKIYAIYAAVETAHFHVDNGRASIDVIDSLFSKIKDILGVGTKDPTIPTAYASSAANAVRLSTTLDIVKRFDSANDAQGKENAFKSLMASGLGPTKEM